MASSLIHRTAIYLFAHSWPRITLFQICFFNAFKIDFLKSYGLWNRRNVDLNITVELILITCLVLWHHSFLPFFILSNLRHIWGLSGLYLTFIFSLSVNINGVIIGIIDSRPLDSNWAYPRVNQSQLVLNNVLSSVLLCQIHLI